MNNPYTPPNSDVDNDAISFPRKRTAGIWAIIVYQGLAVFGMIYSFILMRNGIVPIPETVQQYYNSLGLFDWILRYAGLVIVLLGLIYLFRLRKTAVRLYIAQFTLSIFLYVFDYFTKDNLLYHRPMSWVSTVIGFAIMLSIITYLLKLQKRGVLQ